MWFALAPDIGLVFAAVPDRTDGGPTGRDRRCSEATTAGRRLPYHTRMPSDQTVTLFRQSAHLRARGGTTVHVLDRKLGIMLVPPSPCQAVLHEILAEKVTVAREAIAQRDRAELANRGYCRDCLAALEA